MKTIHKVLLVVLALCAALAIWFWMGGALQTNAYIATARASDQADAFSAAASIVRSGAAPQVFSEASLDSSENYELVDATITLKNKGLFSAEWLELRVNSGDGDVAVYSLSGIGSDVSAFGGGQVNVKIITRNAQATRSATVSYYVLGTRRSVTIPLK